jgi:carnitine 3-dehydrogenase
MAIGAASVEDIDTAIWARPGLRWAAMGPTMLFHLGAGHGGLAEFWEKAFSVGRTIWGPVTLDADTARRVFESVRAETKSNTWGESYDKPDQMIVALLKATTFVRQV